MANQYTNTTPESRFWAYVVTADRTGKGDCWCWVGPKDKDGYGHFSIGPHKEAKRIRAHRFSYTLHYGAIPEGLSILHNCDNPPCCNPRHLKIGTAADNHADCIRRGRKPKGATHWMKINPEKIRRGDDSFSRKHPERLARGERIGVAKLTESKVRQIREMYGPDKYSMKKLASLFHVNRTTIRGVIQFKTWRHIS